MVRQHLGPGPGKYLLPPLVGYKDHDGTKYRNPQYSMGVKLPLSQKERGPGPKYNTENMTEYGKAHPPAYSLASRPNALTTFQGPGPAAYNLQNSPRMKEARPPAYSMSYRHELRRGAETPGPNNYDIPTTLGPKVPDLHANGAFSMSDRYPVMAKERSPGPANYDPTSPNNYKYRSPAYSMSIKHKDFRRGTYPAPSDYYPKLQTCGRGFSFGLRTDNQPYITADDEMPCVNK